MADPVSYPVIVEYTHRHIVWVEAYSQAAAAERMQSEPYEKTDDHETLSSSWWEVREPRSYDWADIYPVWTDGPYTTEADAHVEWHRHVMHMRQREAEKAACIAAGHPEAREPLSDGRVWCKGCVEYLPAAKAVG